MAGAGLAEVYIPDLSGNRLGRTEQGGDPTSVERAKTIDEMSVELLHSGSLYVWFARQFWRLRYAGSHLLVRFRVTQELAFIKKCLDVDKVTKPRARTTADGTHKEKAEERLYEYTLDICRRLETCVQSAFA
eukprot:14556746-Heterocapsa_arctica.AAC.1